MLSEPFGSPLACFQPMIDYAIILTLFAIFVNIYFCIFQNKY